MKKQIIVIKDWLLTYAMYKTWIKSHFPEKMKYFHEGGLPTEGKKYRIIGSVDNIYLIQSLNNKQVFIVDKEAFDIMPTDERNNVYKLYGVNVPSKTYIAAQSYKEAYAIARKYRPKTFIAIRRYWGYKSEHCAGILKGNFIDF